MKIESTSRRDVSVKQKDHYFIIYVSQYGNRKNRENMNMATVNMATVKTIYLWES